VHLLPHQSQVIDVAVESDGVREDPFLLESLAPETSVEVIPSLVQSPVDGVTQVVVLNPTGVYCHLEEGCMLGEGFDAILVEPVEDPCRHGATARLVQFQLSAGQ